MNIGRYTVSAAQQRTGWNVRNASEAAAAILIAQAPNRGGAEYQWRVALGEQRSAVLDFAWPELKVALEIDGPMHFSPYAAASDRHRDHELRSLGWVVFHVDADEPLTTDQLLDQVLRVLQIVTALGAGA